jgi:hypothetical protein
MRSVSMVTRMLSPNCGLSERSPDERCDIRDLSPAYRGAHAVKIIATQA